MRINFFDLGAFDGIESKIASDIFRSLGIEDFKIYTFEPCQKSFDQISSLLKDDPNVKLVKSAISNSNGMSKLYHSFEGNEVGHSIFSSKNNVYESDYEEIETIKFSSFCTNENIDLENGFNIIKINIEGAEWHLFNDLIDSKMIQNIHIFCGEAIDMPKVKELHPYIPEYESMLKKYKIEFVPFSAQGIQNESDRVLSETRDFKNKIKMEYEKMQGFDPGSTK